PGSVFFSFLDGCEEDLQRDALAILMQALDRTPTSAPAPGGANRPREPSKVHRPVFLGYEHLDALAQGFVRRMTEQSFRACVPEPDLATGAGIDDRGMAVS